MIDAIAKRRTTLNGKTYEKGAVVPMPLQQFTDLEPTGRFERAPAKSKAEPKAPDRAD
ncbi:hypothetical protein [Novosphingobium sp. TCA1]|uniref:hypothetical protein n=1 Tax=Novosphingobium sp. TCA1 TaxID=2682474 RepID=UPI001308BD55|nr:hypothetical protein [Novosphingobium sp. TCA1]GFE73450.1 hypothetical protein NTCA1_10990 [Novosphingobium sp. TCA1]